MRSLQQWEKTVIESLRELADVEFQERVWLGGGGEQEVSSPEEAVCQLFDDSGLEELLNRGLVFSKSADALLRKLSDAISTLDLERPVADLLKDDSWSKVRLLASDALNEVQNAFESGKSPAVQ